MNEVCLTLPRAQYNLMVTLLTAHPYNQVADLLHLLQTQAMEPAPEPTKLSPTAT